MDSAWQRFNDQITLDTPLQLQCESLAEPWPAAESAGLMQLNASVLDTLLALDQPRQPLLVDEDRPELGADLQLISARLDLLMAMLGRLLPAPSQPWRRARLNTHGLLLEDPTQLPAGHCHLQLHFRQAPMVPLQLQGHSDPSHPGFVAFTALPPDIALRLERLVFVQHRRQVAASRAR